MGLSLVVKDKDLGKSSRGNWQRKELELPAFEINFVWGDAATGL